MKEQIPGLSVGIMYGGPERSSWKDPLDTTRHRVIQFRRNDMSPLHINVIFQVPGSILTPEFEGVRTGYFSKKDMHLIVQVALPEEVPDNPLGYLRSQLIAAVDEAQTWADKRKMGISLDALRELAASV